MRKAENDLRNPGDAGQQDQPCDSFSAGEARTATVRAEEAALRFIGYRPRTRGEVERRLVRGGFEAVVIESTMERLEEWGYLDDEGFARVFAVSRRDGKGHGARRVRYDLLRRGVDHEIVEGVLADVFAEVDEMDVARRHAVKRWARSEGLDRQRRQRQLRAYLSRRGFGADIIGSILEELETREWGPG